jgi:hypothetical protein
MSSLNDRKKVFKKRNQGYKSFLDEYHKLDQDDVFGEGPPETRVHKLKAKIAELPNPEDMIQSKNHVLVQANVSTDKV